MFMSKRILMFVFASVAVGAAVWALVHSTVRNPQGVGRSADDSFNLAGNAGADAWTRAVEKVKEDRGEMAGGNAALEIPSQLRHYSDRYWFLATQVAEVRRYNMQTCQDFVDLAAMIGRHELVAVPALTDDYILFGVGENADDDVFSRYDNDHNVELYSENQLGDAYTRLAASRSNLQTEIAGLQRQLSALGKRDRSKQSELRKQITARQQELNSTGDDKLLLDEYYGQPHLRAKLFRDYESLRTLANDFGGRAYNIDDPSDRQALKVNMLRSLRPEAFEVMKEIAAAYHRQFDRPLPVSSLIRPEQYQRALRRVNRNAVLIETPPHSTGLAFDIDYRYMSPAEQNFVMKELARLKDEGRIEVLRERSANYHVFVFIDGTRPGDDLIAASLEAAGAPVKEANHATKAAKSAKSKSQKATKAKAKAKGRRR